MTIWGLPGMDVTSFCQYSREMPSTHSFVVSAFSFRLELVSQFFSVSLEKFHAFSLGFRSKELPGHLMISKGYSSMSLMTFLAL
jgi:hypothetical protein